MGETTGIPFGAHWADAGLLERRPGTTARTANKRRHMGTSGWTGNSKPEKWSPVTFDRPPDRTHASRGFHARARRARYHRTYPASVREVPTMSKGNINVPTTCSHSR